MTVALWPFQLLLWTTPMSSSFLLLKYLSLDILGDHPTWPGKRGESFEVHLALSEAKGHAPCSWLLTDDSSLIIIGTFVLKLVVDLFSRSMWPNLSYELIKALGVQLTASLKHREKKVVWESLLKTLPEAQRTQGIESLTWIILLTKLNLYPF